MLKIEIPQTIPIDRTTRRKQESRHRLLAAARQLFTEVGYHKTRPQNISRLADVAYGTFYTHFKDKSDIFFAFACEAQVELSDYIGSRLKNVNGFEAIVRESMNAVFDFSHQHPGVLGAVLVDTRVFDPQDDTVTKVRDLFTEGYIKFLKHGVDKGELRDDFDIKLVSHAIVGMIQHGAQYWYEIGGDRQELVENLTRLIVRAVKR